MDVRQPTEIQEVALDGGRLSCLSDPPLERLDPLDRGPGGERFPGGKRPGGGGLFRLPTGCA